MALALTLKRSKLSMSGLALGMLQMFVPFCMGLCSYYCRHIRGFSEKARPLFNRGRAFSLKPLMYLQFKNYTSSLKTTGSG